MPCTPPMCHPERVRSLDIRTFRTEGQDSRLPARVPAPPAAETRLTRSGPVVAAETRLDRAVTAEEYVLSPSRQEVSSMCHERYLRRRREDEETQAIWQDFERT